MRTGTGVYDATYLGYPYGGGVINAYCGLGYQIPGEWKTGLTLNYIYKTNTDPFTRVRKMDEDPNKAIQHSFIASFNLDWAVSENLTFSPSITWYSILNLDNVEGRCHHDLQIALGGSYSF